jgi:hypothetical protein
MSPTVPPISTMATSTASGSPTGAAFDKLLNFIGDVGDDLHGLAQVVAAAFFVEHALVDLAGGEVVGLAHARFNKRS